MMMENFIKGPLTTLIGLALMVGGGLGFFTHHMSDWAAGGLSLYGLILIFTKDKIPGYVDRIFTTVIKKFGGNGDKKE